MTLAAGTKLGRYEIGSKLGAGGMGEIYLSATRESTKSPISVPLSPLSAVKSYPCR
jgi:hypothetical protein